MSQLRSQVLDDLVPAPFLDRDLHRRRPRGCLDLTHKRAHHPHPTGPLVCQRTPNTTEYQRKNHLKTQTPPKCHESGGLRREVSFEVNTADLLTGLVRQGLGTTLVAPGLAHDVPSCVCIPVSDGPVRVEYLAWDSFLTHDA